MTAAARSNTNNGNTLDLATMESDLASLRRDFAAMANHLKIGAFSSGKESAESAKGAIRDAAGHVTHEAERLYGNMGAQGARSMKAISRQIEEQPLMSLLLAFALGFVGSHLLKR